MLFRSRFLIAMVSVFMASIFTSVVGSISFLGLIVPHIARMVVGNDHRFVLPFSALSGGLLFLFADTLGRSIAYPYEISAAIVMAIIGGPVFLIIMKRSKVINGN